MADLDRHGLRASYKAGCRCAECREANAKRAREFRARRRDGWDAPRSCAKCGATFTPKKRNQRYCCRECLTSHVRPGEHGTYANYTRGCRCEACTSANAATARRYRGTREATRACAVCGAAFTSRLKRQRYCGPDCRRVAINAAVRERAARERKEQTCPMCGQSFTPGGGKGSNRLYCSYPCKVRSRRLSKYGISPAQFRALVESQSYRCAICDSTITVFGSHCDHDHDTGAVRGALCRNCNIGIGHLSEDAAFLRAAARYLERTDPGRSDGEPT